MIMQHELDIASRWCHDHGLVINASKTKIMHIKPPHFRFSEIKLTFHSSECMHKQALSDFDYDTDDCSTTIETVNTYKYLGVFVDQNFKWKTHIDTVRKKLRKAAFMLHHLSYCSNNMVMRQAYFAMIESHIRYGITAWGSSTYCNALQNTQNQILKNLKTHLHNNNQPNPANHQNNIPRNDTAPINRNNYENNAITKELHVLSVSNIYKTTLAIEFYNDARFLTKIDHDHQTRRNVEGRYRVQKYNNNYGRSTLSVKIPTIYNTIPNDVLNKSQNKNIRPKIFKNFFLNQQ